MNFKRTYEYIIHAFRPFTVDNLMKRIESDCKWLGNLAGKHMDACEDERATAHCARCRSDRHYEASADALACADNLREQLLH